MFSISLLRRLLLYFLYFYKLYVITKYNKPSKEVSYFIYQYCRLQLAPILFDKQRFAGSLKGWNLLIYLSILLFSLAESINILDSAIATFTARSLVPVVLATMLPAVLWGRPTPRISKVRLIVSFSTV